MADPTAGTIDVPGAGKVKKQYVIYTGVAVAAFVVYRYWQTRSGDTSEADTPTFGDGYDEFGNLLGEDPMVVSPGSSAGLTDRTPTTTPFAFNNNAEWSQWVHDYLVTYASVPGDQALAAIGEFLAHKPLSTKEQSWIRGAVAVAGPPPQNGPYEVVPETPGTTTPPAQALGAPQASQTSAKPTAVTIKWTSVPTAERYYVSRVGGGSGVSHGANDRSHTSRALKRNTSYTFRIRAARGDKSKGAEIVGPVTVINARTSK